MALLKPNPPQRKSSSEKNRKTKQSKIAVKSQFNHVRWVALFLAIGLMLVSLVLRMQPSMIPKSSALASDVFGKVGIVVMCVWLAWPAVEALWRAPSGMTLVVAVIFAIGLFVYRPKTIYITGPFLVVATALALLLGWLRKLKG